MKTRYITMLAGAVASASVMLLTACSEPTTVASAQSVLAFESTYDALSTAALSYTASANPNKQVVTDIVQANSVVYPYVKALRTTAEAGGTVSELEFSAATVALTQFGNSVKETGATVSIPSTLTTSAAQ